MAASRVLSQALSEVNTPAAESLCYTHSNIVKTSYVWIINNFSLRSEKVGEVLTSSNFSACGDDKLKWCLDLYPKGYYVEDKNYLSLFLRLASHRESDVICTFNFSILNDKGEKTLEMESEIQQFVKVDSSWGFHKFIQQDFLLDKASGLLPEDKLTIFCEVNVIAESVNISRQRNIVVPECNLSEDFGSLLDNGKFSDVTLVVGEREFQAHKAILATRSPVFAAMFKREMNENNLKRIEITDVHHEALHEMLRYIYTDKAPNLAQMAADLLAVAEKYALEKLKAMCEKALCMKLSVETAAEILILADLHRADQLRVQTLNFINIHAIDVIKTVGWENIVATHPHLVAEVSQMLLMKEILPTGLLTCRNDYIAHIVSTILNKLSVFLNTIATFADNYFSPV